jgi:hypothetical protein
MCWQVHRKAAEQLLELCCTNRGVYIKVGQHIGALDYLVPPEYVETMKVLHSQAPRSTIEEVYRVLREDLKQDVRLMKEWYCSCMYTFWQYVTVEKLWEWFKESIYVVLVIRAGSAVFLEGSKVCFCQHLVACKAGEGKGKLYVQLISLCHVASYYLFVKPLHVCLCQASYVPDMLSSMAEY